MITKRPIEGQIEKITIPDDAIPDWLEVLRQPDSQGNILSIEEIDKILGRLNLTYGEAKGMIDIDRELAQLEGYLQKEHGKKLTEEEREYLRASIESKYQ